MKMSTWKEVCIRKEDSSSQCSNSPSILTFSFGLDGEDCSSAASMSGCSNCVKTGKPCTFQWLRSVQDLPLPRGQRIGAGKATPKRSKEPHMLRINSRMPAASSGSVTNTLARDGSLNVSLPPLPSAANMFAPPLGSDPNIPTMDSYLAYQQGNSGTQQSDAYPVTREIHLDDDTTDMDFSFYQTMNWTEPIPSPLIQSDLVCCTATPGARGEPRNTKRAYKMSASERRTSIESRSSASGQHSSLCNSSRRPTLWSEDSRSSGFSTANELLPDVLQQLTTSVNRSFLTTNLMQVYHDSMENALSCWLTDKTCPYSAEIQSLVPTASLGSQESMFYDWGPNWSNRICARVCHLDRVSSAFRDRPLTKAEDKLASRVLHAAIMSFATQWAQSSQRSAREFSSFAETDDYPAMDSNSDTASAPLEDFDRTIQETCWHQARQALQDSGGIESFRVIFAHIIFALTQRPLNVDKHVRESKAKHRASSFSSEISADFETEAASSANHPMSSSPCGAELPGLAELDEIIDSEGPPVFLETALRQIWSYRCKLERIERQRAMQMRKRQFEFGDKAAPYPTRADPLGVEDRKTFNLLFWLSIMFDTLSAAMNKRPLVVSDEDSDVLHNSPHNVQEPDAKAMGQDIFGGPTSYDSMFNESHSNLWDKFLFEQKHLRHRQYVPRWPCSYEDAAATLCDAAPIKVLLFRKVAHLQTLMSRRAHHEKIEETIHGALKVHQSWDETYGRFIIDCMANHDDLPPRIQSWYVVLAGHWHLAGLLLADMIESLDQSNMGLESQRRFRQSSSLVARLRRHNVFAISDLSRCACPRPDSSFAQAREFHTALNKGALLTEPWTVVLIRSFGKAGYILLDSMPPFRPSGDRGMLAYGEVENEQARARCELCIRALWYLGKKSDMSFLAATSLSAALRQKVTLSARSVPEDTPAYGDLNLETESEFQYTLPDLAIDDSLDFFSQPVPGDAFIGTDDTCQVWG